MKHAMTKVAIVEDNKTTRDGLETIVNLSTDFRCVCTCSTAEEALKVLPKIEPELVLMDIQLPSMSGVDCVARLKELLPQVKAIMVTVYEDPDRIFQALRSGASGYLLKRSTPEEVLNAMREVQLGSGAMSGEIARKVIGYFREQATSRVELDELTPREREILELVVHGLSNKDISDRLSLTVESVRWHLKHVYQKLHVHSRTEAALKFRPTK
jgi:DNA-binding NarL/FixJ family response regulator